VRLRRKREEEPPGSDTAVVAPPDPDDAAATATPPPTGAPPPGAGGESPLSVESNSTSDAHPELLVGAAFVGGFALAQIMKRFGE
jgi:hypothetical protein